MITWSRFLCRRGKTISELRPLTGILFISMRYMSMESHDGTILTGDNRRTRSKTCTSATLTTTNHIRTDQGAKPGLHGDKTWCGVKNTFGTSVYSGEYPSLIFLISYDRVTTTWLVLKLVRGDVNPLWFRNYPRSYTILSSPVISVCTRVTTAKRLHGPSYFVRMCHGNAEYLIFSNRQYQHHGYSNLCRRYIV
jgi:hypothetical protein